MWNSKPSEKRNINYVSSWFKWWQWYYRSHIHCHQNRSLTVHSPPACLFADFTITAAALHSKVAVSWKIRCNTYDCNSVYSRVHSQITEHWLIDWLNGEVFNFVFTGGTCTDACMLWVWGLVSLNIHLFLSIFHSRFKNGLSIPDSAFNFAIKGITYTNPIFMSDWGGGIHYLSNIQLYL